MEILDPIPFDLDRDDLLRRTHVEAGSPDAAELMGLAGQVLPLARPKALYQVCDIVEKAGDSVTIAAPGGPVTFTSHILRANLEVAERLFAYIATCGPEMDRRDLCGDDILKEFWLDNLKSLALGAAIRHLSEHLNARYALGKSATLSPGSADATVWPIQQQRQLFAVFGDAVDRIGVRLTDSCLMVPNKTVSGVRFPTEIDFRSCQVCHREDCPSRSAPFDPALLAAYEHGLEGEV
ncbi:MAG: hypothetical protein ABIL09_09055 [Gemmatimonadota bacterium]